MLKSPSRFIRQLYGARLWGSVRQRFTKVLFPPRIFTRLSPSLTALFDAQAVAGQAYHYPLCSSLPSREPTLHYRRMFIARLRGVSLPEKGRVMATSAAGLGTEEKYPKAGIKFPKNKRPVTLKKDYTSPRSVIFFKCYWSYLLNVKSKTICRLILAQRYSTINTFYYIFTRSFYKE